MIQKEQDFRADIVQKTAEQMAIAARTAPKGRGIDLLEIIIIKDKDIKKLSDKMLEIGEREDHKTFIRDSRNILQSQAILIVGTKKQTLGLKYCGLCGFKNCAENEKNDGICAFNTGDLGIALGSAASVAAHHHVDNRLMYTVGMAALEMRFVGEDVKVAYGIPLSVSGKNPFFDRK